MRTRNFATVVYPDSINTPENWLDVLRSHFVPCFVSPLHKDDYRPNGEEKKAHYHIMIMFDSVKTEEQAKQLFDSIGGVGLEIVKSVRGYARYLCHLDDPDKAQYKPDDVICICGADYHSIISLTIDKYVALCEMEEFCEKYNVLSFFALSRYASTHRSDWSRVLKECGTRYMSEYLKSRKWSIENDLLHIVDPETGEVII
jgi:hypothetical protein